MRAFSSGLAALASIATIVFGAVRLWWSKPRRTPPGQPDLPPKAPSWLQQLAKWWLIVLLIGGTIVIVVVIIYVLIDLSA